MSDDPAILVLVPQSAHVAERCGAIAPVVMRTRAEVLAADDPSLRGVRALVGWSHVVDAAMLDRLPVLELVANVGVGYDKVDVAAATARGIAVIHTPGVLDEDVADLAVALLLMTVRRLGEAERFVRDGHWLEGPFPLTTTLRGRRVGILGMGRIGSAIARRLQGFDVALAYCNRRPRPELAYPYHPDARSLAAAVDTLVCVLPGGDGTRHMVDGPLLDALGPDGILVNIGRGSTVDETALATAIRERRIAGAGLDVFEREPLAGGVLPGLERVVLLPHVGSATVHTRAAMTRLACDNIAAWFAEGRTLTPVPETTAAGLASLRPR